MKETMQKKEKIRELFLSVDCPEVHQFLDLESDKMLDEKIEVLQALEQGKTIGEIPNFYDILERMPKTGMWDL